MINYCSNNILLCILYYICCVWTVNKITNTPQHRDQSYTEMNIFLIMCLTILIVLTLRTVASNWFHNLTLVILININLLFFLQKFTLKFPFLLDLISYECIYSIVMNFCCCRMIGNMLFLSQQEKSPLWIQSPEETTRVWIHGSRFSVPVPSYTKLKHTRAQTHLNYHCHYSLIKS